MTERETPITHACRAWRAVLPVHPACEIIPAYDQSKLIDLGRDIKQSGGTKIPIIILRQSDGRLALLDGCSRLDALCHVGIKFEIKVIDGHVTVDAPGYDIPPAIEIVSDENFNVYAFVLSTNLHRRHLKNTEKRTITKKLICAQPTLSDRAIARMAGVDGKTVNLLREEINANAEFRIGYRVEVTGRKARGRKPSQTSPQEQVAPPADEAPLTSITIVKSPPKTKATVGADTFKVTEILGAARKALDVLSRPVSAPNYEAARKEILHVIELVKTNMKSSTAVTPAKAA